MKVNGMKIGELMTMGDTMRNFKNQMMPKMALWYSSNMRNNYNLPSQMNMDAMIDSRDILSRQQVSFQKPKPNNISSNYHSYLSNLAYL